MVGSPLSVPIYGFVGVPMQMYFHNFMLYENDDVHIRIANSNNGRLYKKRWEYTPNAEKTFTQRIVVCDHNFNELNNDSFNVVIKGSSVKSSLKVLVIGDSTVNHHLETQKMFSAFACHIKNGVPISKILKEQDRLLAIFCKKLVRCLERFIIYLFNMKQPQVEHGQFCVKAT